MNAWTSFPAPEPRPTSTPASPRPDHPRPAPPRRGSPPRRGAAAPLRARDRILAIVRAMLAEGSYETLSLEAVAAAAGVTRRTVYNQFADKTDLYRTSRLALIAGVAADLAGDVPPRMPLADGLRYFTELANDVLSDPRNLEITRSIVRDGASQPWLASEHDRQIRRPLRRALETYLLHQLPRCRRDDDAGAIAARLVTLLEAMATGPQLRNGTGASPLAHGEERAMVAAGYARLLDS